MEEMTFRFGRFMHRGAKWRSTILGMGDRLSSQNEKKDVTEGLGVGWILFNVLSNGKPTRMSYVRLFETVSRELAELNSMGLQ